MIILQNEMKSMCECVCTVNSRHRLRRYFSRVFFLFAVFFLRFVEWEERGQFGEMNAKILMVLKIGTKTRFELRFVLFYTTWYRCYCTMGFHLRYFNVLLHYTLAISFFIHLCLVFAANPFGICSPTVRERTTGYTFSYILNCKGCVIFSTLRVIRC